MFVLSHNVHTHPDVQICTRDTKVVLSVLVSSRISPSIFDRISFLSGLPNMVLPQCDIRDKVASDVALWPSTVRETSLLLLAYSFLCMRVLAVAISLCLLCKDDVISAGSRSRQVTGRGIGGLTPVLFCAYNSIVSIDARLYVIYVVCTTRGCM